ncbi:MAG TPA: nucleotidyltransferase domain-containing protein [Flavisolibacter sp.]|nr:nucleotidyltransferase domain-containing protein [Flavisolibacter sp.]
MDASIQNKEMLLHRLLSRKEKIRSFGVSRLGIFGSFVSGTSIRSDSDVDFFVEFEKDKKTFDNFMDLSFYLEELLGRRVELITPQSLNKYIGPKILKQVENVFS